MSFHKGDVKNIPQIPCMPACLKNSGYYEVQNTNEEIYNSVWDTIESFPDADAVFRVNEFQWEISFLETKFHISTRNVVIVKARTIKNLPNAFIQINQESSDLELVPHWRLFAFRLFSRLTRVEKQKQSFEMFSPPTVPKNETSIATLISNLRTLCKYINNLKTPNHVLVGRIEEIFLILNTQQDIHTRSMLSIFCGYHINMEYLLTVARVNVASNISSSVLSLFNMLTEDKENAIRYNTQNNVQLLTKIAVKSCKDSTASISRMSDVRKCVFITTHLMRASDKNMTVLLKLMLEVYRLTQRQSIRNLILNCLT